MLLASSYFQFSNIYRASELGLDYMTWSDLFQLQLLCAFQVSFNAVA